MTEIYTKLKEMREKTGLRQGQIAEYLGVTQTFISKVETGERSLSVDQVERLISLYGCDFASFVRNDQEPKPLKFAFRAQDVSTEDLLVISEISQIAVNSRFMNKLLEGSDGNR